MDKAKFAQILGHQLKGIMLHVDLFNAYLFYGNKHCACKHYRHALAETKNFMLTNELAIETLQEIVEPTREAKIVLPADEEELFTTWQNYEHDTALFYHQLMIDNPKICWLKKLYRSALNEISA